MSTDFDLAIVGAGPAGIAAATEAAQRGLSVVVLDDQPAPGGQIWRGIEAATTAGHAATLGASYTDGADKVAAFRATGVDYRPATQVWQMEPGWRVFTVCDGQAAMIEADAVLLAIGAQERPAPFPGWTLPGVMTVGAAQIALKTARQVPDGPVWIAGAGPLLYLYATQLMQAGGKVAGILETTRPGALKAALRHLPAALRKPSDLATGLRWMRDLRRAGVPVIRNVSDLRAEGDGKVQRVAYATADGQTGEHAADMLLVHEGVVPSIHATMAAGCDHDWDETQQCYAPRLDEWGESSVLGLYVAGDAAGIGGADAATLRGRLAAVGIAGRTGGRAVDTPAADDIRAELRRELAPRAFLNALYAPRPQLLDPPDETILCRCEEVTAGRVRELAEVGTPGPNQMKSFTRVGMGPCQGRMCAYTLSQVLARSRGTPPQDEGFLRIRPPLRQISLGELATLEVEAADVE